MASAQPYALYSQPMTAHVISEFYYKIHLWSHLWHNLSLRGSVGSFDRARSGCEHSASFKSDNMQNKYGGSIRSHDCYLKRCVRISLTYCGFYLMESRVSNNYARNIYKHSTPEKEVNRKENTVGKIVKRRQVLTKFYSIT